LILVVSMLRGRSCFEEVARMKMAKHKDRKEDESVDRSATETRAMGEIQSVFELRKELAGKVADRAIAEGDSLTEIAGLRLYRRSVPTACASAAYEPSLVVFLQGQKRIHVGKTVYICDGSNFLLTSVDLPVVSQVIAATEKEPILCLLLKLEMPMVREILSQQEFHLRGEAADARGMAVGVTSLELLDACLRLVNLLDAPQDIPFLGSLIQREIIYRLLRSPQGKHLRAIATLGEQSHRTSKAVEWLRMNYAKPLRIDEARRHGAHGRFNTAPSVSFAHRDEPAAIPETASFARGARTDAERWPGCGQRGL
jgi:hypothetical protein